MSYMQASRDHRVRAIAALDVRRSVGEVAAVIGMDTSTVRRWHRLHAQTGRTGRSAPLLELDDTLVQYQTRRLAQTGVRLSLSALGRTLPRRRLTVRQRR